MGRGLFNSTGVLPMSTAASIQNIDAAIAQSFPAGQFCAAFDNVKITSLGGGYIDLFLPSGTGQAVADAINAAVKPTDEVAL
jgi:hypothetical protein